MNTTRGSLTGEMGRSGTSSSISQGFMNSGSALFALGSAVLCMSLAAAPARAHQETESEEAAVASTNRSATPTAAASQPGSETGSETEAQPGLPIIDGVIKGVDGVRLRSSGVLQSISGRLDFRDQIIVTIVGQGLSADLERTYDASEVAGLDGSGLVTSLSLRATQTSSGLQLVTATFLTRQPATFRVAVEHRDVVVSFQPREIENSSGASGASNSPGGEHGTGAKATTNGGRRVIGPDDLEPVPGQPAARTQSPGTSASTTGTGAALGPDELDARDAAWDLGEPGAWQERLGEALGGSEAPTWRDAAPSPQGVTLGPPSLPVEGIDRALLSERELAQRERALRESQSRELETAQRDLREARAEAASLRIDLAWRDQELRTAHEDLSTARTRIEELEAELRRTRDAAVQARSELERSLATRSALEERLRVAESESLRLAQRVEQMTVATASARAQLTMVTLEADALRLALEGAERELIDRPQFAGAEASTDAPEIVTGFDLRTSSAAAPTAGSTAADSVAAASPSSIDVDPVPPRFSPTADQPLGFEHSIAATLAAWAAAWSSRDIDTYLGYYASVFDAGNRSRASWEEQRRARLEDPEWIEVNVGTLVVEPVDQHSLELPRGATVRARFLQSYRSPAYQDVVRKEMLLVREADGWRIVSERSAPLASSPW